MKLRMIKLTPESLMRAMRGKADPSILSLPEDTELMDIKYDLFTKQVIAVVRSDSFEDVPESHPIPEFNAAYPTKAKTTPQITPSPKPELQTQPSSKPEVDTVKRTQIQPSRYTSRIEDEFTPEQRKLMSFRVEGDCVIAKPIQFLKAEWDDINETVKSLGGKWVKGDIISYWAIPLQ